MEGMVSKLSLERYKAGHGKGLVEGEGLRGQQVQNPQVFRVLELPSTAGLAGRYLIWLPRKVMNPMSGRVPLGGWSGPAQNRGGTDIERGTLEKIWRASSHDEEPQGIQLQAEYWVGTSAIPDLVTQRGAGLSHTCSLPYTIWTTGNRDHEPLSIGWWGLVQL